MVRELRKAAKNSGEDAAARRALVKMIPQWEQGDRAPASGSGDATGRLACESQGARLYHRPHGPRLSDVPRSGHDASRSPGRGTP